MATITHEVTLDIVTCGECGTPFGIERNRHRQIKDRGETFYCPNGHPRVYSTSTVDELKGQLTQEAKTRELLETRLRNANSRADTYRSERDHADRHRAAMVGQVTKLRKRLVEGVCPCCDRTFADIAEHMASEHPGFEHEPVDRDEAVTLTAKEGAAL